MPAAAALALPDLPTEATRPAAGNDLPRVGLRRAGRFFPELESVRGIAILMVFAFHLDLYVRFPHADTVTTPLALAFVRAGHSGVDLFLVLSAFLLSLPFIADAAGGKRVLLRDYFMRRALRILPLFYTAVVVGAVLSAERMSDLLRALPYFVFLNSFAQFAPHLPPYSNGWWSIATEVQFYFLLPLLLAFLPTPRGRRAGLLVLAAYVLAYAAFVRGWVTMGSIGGQLHLQLSVFGRGSLFLWGILGAAVYHHFGARVRERLAGVAWLRNGGADVALLTLLVANAAFLQWVVSLGLHRETAGMPWHVVNGGLWTAFILILLLAPLRTKRLFSNAALGQLGVFSYSVYLTHFPIIQHGVWGVRAAWPEPFGAGWTLPTAGLAAGLTAGCLGLSALLYRFVEKPFLVRKRRFDS